MLVAVVVAPNKKYMYRIDIGTYAQHSIQDLIVSIETQKKELIHHIHGRHTQKDNNYDDDTHVL